MTQTRGQSGFDNFYKSIFLDSWESLRAALLTPSIKSQLKNIFYDGDVFSEFYELDPASMLVAKAMDVKAGETILDLCASPGGKSLVMLFSAYKNSVSPHSSGELHTEKGTHFTLNDMSRDRVNRLKKVLNEFVPDRIRENIAVTCYDGSRYGLFKKNIYDRILVDAPCSGERHLLEDAKALEQWSKKRSVGLAMRQFALLCSALMAVKNNGRIVYSTCSISPLENDDVIEKLLKRREGQVVVEQNLTDEFFNDFFNEIPASDKNYVTSEKLKTKYGYQIRPDRHASAGPMYFCVLKKISD